MSMPTPPHPQGPYGHPQQPNPYGGQPQQQYPPYQHQPYPPQQPYPGPGMWGQPPMGPPPRKNRTALTLFIAFGSIPLVLLLVWFGNRGSDSDSSSPSSGSEPFPSAGYRLTVPKTLLSGQYKLVKDESAEADKEAANGGYGTGPDSRNVKATIGSYTGTDTDAPGGLVITGMYGQFREPEEARTDLLRGIRETEGMSEPGPPKMITPAGSELTLECTVLLSEDAGVTSTIPLCAWADENTVGSVMLYSSDSASQDPDSVDLDATALTTLKVRDEARQPIAP